MNHILRTIACIAVVAIGCGNHSRDNAGNDTVTLADARKGFATKLTRHTGAKGPVPVPPKELFSIVAYPAALGNMDAYLGSIPDDGKLHPAMIWITGGFGNDIGDVWTEQPEENDQSASAIRKAGIVMMYPAQRGGNMNPGSDETLFGEIDDIIAAAQFLSKQKGIDPERIYLGGHSTGGTKVLLAAASTGMFRAVFSLGPVPQVRLYGDDQMNFDTGDEQECYLRSPLYWLKAIHTPVFVFEGEAEPSNIDGLDKLESRAKREGDTLLKFYGIPDRDHFSAIRPVCDMIAAQIIADSSKRPVQMDFSQAAAAVK